jgi:Insect cuticle protein
VCPHFDRLIPGPGTYAFGYDIDDAQTGNTQFREEERLPNGTVIGKYGYVEPDGNIHVVNYIADERGYRLVV